MAAQLSTLGAASTADDVIAALVSVKAIDKTVMITGANAGIGFETARALATAGAHVVLLCRSQPVVDETIARLRETCPRERFSVSGIPCDLSSLGSVRAAAAAFLATRQPLHVLINNAGVMLCPLSHTAEGNETQFGVNHLGHFALTAALLPVLLSSAPSRVVNVSSTAHALFAPPGGVRFADLVSSAATYDPAERYGQSKLCNVLHARELQRRYASAGLTAVSLHPGAIFTKLYRHVGVRALYSCAAALVFPSRWWILGERPKSIPQGAATTVFCALAPGVTGGALCAVVCIYCVGCVWRWASREVRCRLSLRSQYCSSCAVTGDGHHRKLHCLRNGV